MATKPTVSTEWATQDVANGSNSTNNKVESTASHKAFGITFPEPPGRNHLNYWMNAADQWFTYYDEQDTGSGVLNTNYNINAATSNYAGGSIVIGAGTVNTGKTDLAQTFIQSTETTIAVTAGSVVYIGVNVSDGVIAEYTSNLYLAGNEIIPLYRVTTSGAAITQVIDLRTAITGTVVNGGYVEYDPQTIGSIHGGYTGPTVHNNSDPGFFMGRYSGTGTSALQGLAVTNSSTDYIEYSPTNFEVGSGVSSTLNGSLTVNDDFRAENSGTDFVDFSGSNLSVGSTTAVDKSIRDKVLPVGTIIEWGLSIPPSGFLELNGTAISRTTYADLFAVVGTTWGVGNGSTTFNIRDDRGEFKRGWDHSRGVDSGRGLNTYQSDELESHTHTTPLKRSNGEIDGSNYAGAFTDSDSRGVATSNATGGSETRPRNVSTMYCVKY
tara:strand:+ start:460 stop:1773 length:1314 start_codon:yes stop_codon:yes gene_type:complete